MMDENNDYNEFVLLISWPLQVSGCINNGRARPLLIGERGHESGSY